MHTRHSQMHTCAHICTDTCMCMYAQYTYGHIYACAPTRTLAPIHTCVCTQAHAHTCASAHTCARTYRHGNMHIHTCAQALTHIYGHGYIHTCARHSCMHTCAHRETHVHTYRHGHIHAHRHSHTHTHTGMHTHMPLTTSLHFSVTDREPRFKTEQRSLRSLVCSGAQQAGLWGLLTPPPGAPPPEATEAMEGLLPAASLALGVLFSFSLHHLISQAPLRLYLIPGCPQCAQLSALRSQSPSV